ncbi:HSP20-like chaperone [Sesbania bispinosa]|nr:HSP20-like chaperone [Sesbania bispinosa]
MASARGTPRVGIRTIARTPVVEEIVPNSGWTEDSTGHYLLVDLPEFRKQEVKLQVDSHGRIVVKGERQANEQKRVRFQLTFPAPVDSDMDKIAGNFDGGILYVTVPKRIAQENRESETEQAGNGHVEREEENNSHEPNAANEGRDPNQHVSQTEQQIDSHEPNADNEGRDTSHHVSHTEQEEKRNENAHISDFPEQVIRKLEQESMLRSAAEVLRKNKGIVITAVIAFSMGLFVSSKFGFSSAA